MPAQIIRRSARVVIAGHRTGLDEPVVFQPPFRTQANAGIAVAFAIVIGAMLVALAPVGIVAPGGYLEALKDFAARLPLVHAGAVTWVVMSLLVLIHPTHGRSLNERFVRVLAWLVLVKSLAMLWIPGFLPFWEPQNCKICGALRAPKITSKGSNSHLLLTF